MAQDIQQPAPPALSVDSWAKVWTVVMGFLGVGLTTLGLFHAQVLLPAAARVDRIEARVSQIERDRTEILVSLRGLNDGQRELNAGIRRVGARVQRMETTLNRR